MNDTAADTQRLAQVWKNRRSSQLKIAAEAILKGDYDRAIMRANQADAQWRKNVCLATDQALEEVRVARMQKAAKEEQVRDEARRAEEKRRYMVRPETQKVIANATLEDALDWQNTSESWLFCESYLWEGTDADAEMPTYVEGRDRDINNLEEQFGRLIDAENERYEEGLVDAENKS